MDTIYHILRSQNLFDEPAAEVHYWIDQYWNGIKDDHKHRHYLHNNLGLHLCIDKFGYSSKKHFIQHMIDDEVNIYE